jgi:hypothetical protein
VKGAHCHVAWGKVCRPMKLGGLGISSLKELGWALRMRWSWLEKTNPNQPWSALPIWIHDKVRAFFSVAMQAEIGDGSNTLFLARPLVTWTTDSRFCTKINCSHPQEND